MDTPFNTAQTLNTQFVEACKVQAEVNLALTSAMVAGAEHIRAAQLEAAHQTEARLDQGIKEIGDAQTLQDLLALHRNLLIDCHGGLVFYWTSIAKLGQQTQQEMAGLLKETCTKAFAQACASSADGALPPSIKPFASAMKMAFEAAGDANAALIKAMNSGDAATLGEKKTRKVA